MDFYLEPGNSYTRLKEEFVNCKKLKLLEASKGYLTERRNAFLSPLNSV